MLQRIAAPADLILLSEAKDALRVQSVREDAFIQQAVRAATQYLDGPSGILGRCLCTQTWRLTMEAFDGEIALPLGPVQSVSSVKYLDASDVEQTYSSANYYLYTAGTCSRIALKSTASWPSTSSRKDAARVEFVTGYGPPDDVPYMLRQAVLVLTAHMYEHREVQVNERTWGHGFSLMAMVAPYRLVA